MNLSFTYQMFTSDELENILSLIDFHDVEDYETIKENWGFDIETLRDKVCDLLTESNVNETPNY